MLPPTTLRVGYVPEHFSTPLHFSLIEEFHYPSLTVSLTPFPSGTGHMIRSLEENEIDAAIGLTEGWIAALGNGNKAFKIVGKYVDSPLCWAISTGKERADVTGVEKLRGGKLGVSRIGSGSYVMGYVLADREGWLEEGKEPFECVVLNDFLGLRKGVSDGTADAFMWEHFTSKLYYDLGEIRKIGQIYTPWPSWHIVARAPVLADPAGAKAVAEFLDGLNKGVRFFLENQDRTVEYIAANLDYTEADAREWLGTVKFAEDVRVVEDGVVELTLGLLRKAGVVKGEEVGVGEMVWRVGEEV
ncbi:hypothetical protein RUND412_009991 [Rhizina undulata]